MMEGESSVPLKAGSISVAVFPANNEEGNLSTDVCRRQGWPVSEVRVGCENEGQRSEVTTFFKTLGFETVSIPSGLSKHSGGGVACE